VTTDGFTVQPLEFPGGNIGSLAVHGTVNDLAVSGAVPRFMTLNVFLEEGLEIALLSRVLGALADAARESGVSVAAGEGGQPEEDLLAAQGADLAPRDLEFPSSRCVPEIAY
jgi:hydrogenase expression/formation protein HypE